MGCRVSGRLAVSMSMNGQVHAVEGEFLEVRCPERLTFRFGPDEIIDARFTRTPSGSRVEVLHRQVENASSADIRRAGWTECLH